MMVFCALCTLSADSVRRILCCRKGRFPPVFQLAPREREVLRNTDRPWTRTAYLQVTFPNGKKALILAGNYLFTSYVGCQ
jgi:hypothetical protein